MDDMSDLYKPYKISEKDFIKDEFDCLICEYNGYKIEISYSNEDLCWYADAFDLETEEYVFYPCLIVSDKDKTQLNDVIQKATKYIDENNKSKSIGDKNILIYIKENMKYKVGDRVKVKSNDFFNNNKGKLSFYVDSKALCFANEIVTIKSYGRYPNTYRIDEDEGDFLWTDDMIEGLAEDLLDKEIQEHQKICDEAFTIKGIEPTEEVWHCPEGYQFVDENGKIINAQKIVLEKKEKKYPKTYKECCEVLDWNHRDYDRVGYESELLCKFQVLLLCRDAYWKIAGDWRPEFRFGKKKYCIMTKDNKVISATVEETNRILAFPTEEMRDAFYENFKSEIEICKELL